MWLAGCDVHLAVAKWRGEVRLLSVCGGRQRLLVTPAASGSGEPHLGSGEAEVAAVDGGPGAVQYEQPGGGLGGGGGESRGGRVVVRYLLLPCERAGRMRGIINTGAFGEAAARSVSVAMAE